MNKKRVQIPYGQKHGLFIIGLTGGSGAGKSVAAAELRRHGIPVLDTDKVSRTVCEPGQPCLEALTVAFGAQILNPDGTLNRRGLAEDVFSEPDEKQRAEKLQKLNEITHHYILQACYIWMDTQCAAGNKIVCIDAPQLFESRFHLECSRIIAVVADREIRIRRIIARDFITREAAEKRISAQHDDAFFAENCDALVENNTTPDAVAPQIDAILEQWALG